MLKNSLHWTILVCAFLTAIVYAFVFRKKSNRIFQDKISLFKFALCFFISILSNEGYSQQKQQATSITKSKKIKLPKEISSPANWKEFKTLWWELYEKRATIKTQKEKNIYQERLAKVMGYKDFKTLELAKMLTIHKKGYMPNIRRLTFPEIAMTLNAEKMLLLPQDNRDFAATRCFMPPPKNLSTLKEINFRLTMIKKLKKEGKISSKAYKKMLEGLSNAVTLKTIHHLAYNTIIELEPPVLATYPGKTCIVPNLFAPKIVSKPKTEISDTKVNLWPPMDQEEQKLYKKLLELKDKTIPNELLKKINNQPNAWVRGISLAIFNIKNGTPRKDQRPRWHKSTLQKFEKLMTDLKALYKVRYKIDKLLKEICE